MAPVNLPTINVIDTIIKNKSIAHCYILTGSPTSFRQDCLTYFDQKLHGDIPSPSDSLTVFESGSIKIDSVRTLLDRIKYGPSHSQYLTVAIPEVQQLTPQAANALLKTLESPPENVIFLLSAPTPSLVLPTILSRSCLIHCHPVSDQELRPWLREHGVSEKWDAAPNTVIHAIQQGISIPETMPTISDLRNSTLGNRLAMCQPIGKTKDIILLGMSKWIEELSAQLRFSTNAQERFSVIKTLDFLVENILHLRYNPNPRLFLDRILMSL